MKRMFAKSAIIMALVVWFLDARSVRAEDIEVTGEGTVKETLTREYGATESPAVGDILAETRYVALKDDVPTTYMLLRAKLNNVTSGAEQSLISLMSMNNGVVGLPFNILGYNVGIGTSSPAKTLDVNGTFRTSGNSYMGGVTNNVNSGNNFSKGYGLWTRDDVRMDGQDLSWIKFTYGDRNPQFTWDAGSLGYAALYRGRAALSFIFDRINGTYDAPTQLVDGDVILTMGATARNPNATHTASHFISVQVNGTPSGNTVPMAVNVGPHMNVGVGVNTPKNKMDVEGAAVVGANYSGSNTAPSNGLLVEGNVGIGTTSPSAKLNVNGNVLVNNGTLMLTDIATSPSAVSGRSGIFSYQAAGTSELFATDGAGNKTRLSSHAEPPVGFDPPEVDALPWSIQHANSFIGRGQVVNMSKLVRLVEDLTGNQLAYDYDLPADWRLDFDAWKKSQVEQMRKDYIQRELDREPRVEVSAEEAIKSTTQNGEMADPVLKNGYQRDEKSGRYYRTRTASEIKVPAIAEPQMPEWIKARIGVAAPVRAKNGKGAQQAQAICSPESRAQGDASIAIGGRSNVVSGDGSAVIGGSLNSVRADRAAVVAGEGNEATGADSVVLGGHGNKAAGIGSVVSGAMNRSDADLSFVGGHNLSLAQSAYGTFAWGDAPATHTVTADHAFLIFPAGGGSAAIGTDTVTTGTRLEVAGGDLRVTNGAIVVDGKRLAMPDYVFEPGYKLMSAEELRAFLESNRHLPGVPSRDEISQKGLDISQFQLRLLEKVEELTLYSLAQQERIEKLEKQIEQQNEKLKTLQAR